MSDFDQYTSAPGAPSGSPGAEERQNRRHDHQPPQHDVTVGRRDRLLLLSQKKFPPTKRLFMFAAHTIGFLHSSLPNFVRDSLSYAKSDEFLHDE